MAILRKLAHAQEVVGQYKVAGQLKVAFLIDINRKKATEIIQETVGTLSETYANYLLDKLLEMPLNQLVKSASDFALLEKIMKKGAGKAKKEYMQIVKSIIYDDYEEQI